VSSALSAGSILSVLVPFGAISTPCVERFFKARSRMFIERIAGHFLADPARKVQFLALLFELNFGDYDALEDAVINVDVPRCPG
jgi:hypothetical protein